MFVDRYADTAVIQTTSVAMDAARDRIAALVRTAIGFDQKRGDQVEVVNLRFAEVPTFTLPEPQGITALLA